MKHPPVIATILALAAIATMIGLGIWQLQRKGEKEALLAQYAVAADQPTITYPMPPISDQLPLYRRSSIECLSVKGWRAVSGHNDRGEAGWAHLASCQTTGAEGPGATIAVGWSKRPDAPDWNGGLVHGVIAPDKEHLIKLVAGDDIAGLERLAPPSTDNIANNHLLYAVQWFIFAFAAAVIFGLAVRKRNIP